MSKVMTKEQLQEIARSLASKKVSPHAGGYTIAGAMGAKKPLKKSEERRVIKAFLMEVLRSDRYSVVEHMHAKKALAKLSSVKL